MAKFAICNRSSYKDTPFAVHAFGCRDIEKNEKRTHGASVSTFEGDVDGAVAHVLDEEMREMGYDESHVRVFPCCKGAA